MQKEVDKSPSIAAGSAPPHVVPHHSHHDHPWPRWAALAAALLVPALWWLLAQSIEASATRVSKGSVAEVVYATGIVEPVNWAKVAAPLRKRIVDLCKCEGETVKPGDVLARLDDSAERAELAELEARLAKVQDDAKRHERLLERNATPVATYEEKLTQVREYEARIAAQKTRIGELALKSPIEGIVLKRVGEVGEIAGTTANDVLIWVGQLKPLHVVSDVNEDDIARVRVGQKVLLRHEGHKGTPLEATVKRVRPKGDADTKTFRVYLSLPDDTPLMIGMSVEANIVVAEKAEALLVPAEAVHDGWVQTVRDGRIVRKPVVTGLHGTSRIEIAGDVTENAQILSPFRPDLEEGTRVRAKQTAKP
ncbi:MAG: efflux RND transporter periplasmic adaptor subunit [Hyphomicrobium sp.]|nr:efflux RND transporter periplasmic adaptor subunit [Hyphomicrobium sp.]